MDFSLLSVSQIRMGRSQVKWARGSFFKLKDCSLHLHCLFCSSVTADSWMTKINHCLPLEGSHHPSVKDWGIICFLKCSLLFAKYSKHKYWKCNVGDIYTLPFRYSDASDRNTCPRAERFPILLSPEKENKNSLALYPDFDFRII